VVASGKNVAGTGTDGTVTTYVLPLDAGGGVVRPEIFNFIFLLHPGTDSSSFVHCVPVTVLANYAPLVFEDWL